MKNEIRKEEEIINDICVGMCTEGNVYSDILITNLGNDRHLKGALISELAMIIISQSDKVIKAVEEGWFKYWLVNVIKKQVRSSTSPFHKDNRLTGIGKAETFEINEEIIEMTEDNDLEYKKIKEEEYNLLNQCREKLKVSFFDAEVFKLYFDEGLTYRQIEAEYNIDHCLAWHSVKKTKKKLLNIIEQHRK